MRKGILEVKPEDISQVYSGRPGCGCGCLGKYYSNGGDPRNFVEANPKMVKRVLNKFQKLEKANPGFFSENQGNGPLPRHGVNVGLDGEDIFYHETETRYYWMYLKRY